MEDDRNDLSGTILIKKAVTIQREPEDLYSFWRSLENLPMLMEHLESVEIIDERRSQWTARGPAGKKIDWTAVITEDIPNKIMNWRSIEGSDVIASASVQFEPAPGNRGTEVKLMIRYDPPGGILGAAVVKLFGKDPGKEIREGLRRFKQLMETGEIMTIEGQPSGRSEDLERAKEKAA
jgi:uncharacterized membrane protein